MPSCQQNHDPILAGCQIHVKTVVGLLLVIPRGQTNRLGGVELPERCCAMPAERERQTGCPEIMSNAG